MAPGYRWFLHNWRMIGQRVVKDAGKWPRFCDIWRVISTRAEADRVAAIAESKRQATLDRLCKVIPHEFRTIKAAKAAGWRELKQNEYGGSGHSIIVKGHRLYGVPERAMSKTEWETHGYKPIDLDDYHVLRRSHETKRIYPIYRKDQVRLVSPLKLEFGSELHTALECAFYTLAGA